MELPGPGGIRTLMNVPTHPRLQALRNLAVVICTPCHLRRTLLIAAIVGSWLTLFNEGGQLLHLPWSGILDLRVFLDYLTPFVVANLGIISRH